MAEDKTVQVPAAKVYQSEALDTQALRLRVRSDEAEEQPTAGRKSPLKGTTVPQTREMVLKLIERFKRL